VEEVSRHQVGKTGVSRGSQREGRIGPIVTCNQEKKGDTRNSKRKRGPLQGERASTGGEEKTSASVCMKERGRGDKRVNIQSTSPGFGDRRVKTQSRNDRPGRPLVVIASYDNRDWDLNPPREFQGN